MRILSAKDVRQVFTMSDALAAVEVACAENVKGNTDIPNRIQIKNSPNHSDTLFMPARIGKMEALGLKIVSGMPGNSSKGLPVNIGIVVVFDDTTGLPLLVMEAGYLTDVRTGALTGVASKYLARPEASVLGLIGTGAQAQTQVLALVEVLELKEVRVYSRKPERVRSFIQTMKLTLPKIKFIPAANGNEAVRNADVVVCATTASQPVISREWISPGACVCAIGAHTPEDREADSATVRDASIVVADYTKAVLAAGGDVIIPIEEGLISQDQLIDLGELVLGKRKGRQTAEELTFFKSVGFASLDIYLGKAILKKAEELQVGIEVPLY